MKRQWTVEDEINLIKWVDHKGFRLVYMPNVEEWGYTHIKEPKIINGGFKSLLEIKQHLANMKGVNKDVCIVLPDEVQEKMAQARRVLNLH